ncbi:MAG: hypothetical protein AAF432_06550 [Planctomycetota bacterium]
MSTDPHQRVADPVVPHGTALPPAPPGTRYVRIIWLGVVIADDHLRQRINEVFHRPMIYLALLTLPLLAFEFLILAKHVQAELDPLWWLCAQCMLMIWVAFFIEYVVKICLAESRVEYARRHWLDAMIILLPVLRPLRVAYIARTTRVFTLRGVGMKFVKYVFTVLLGMEATDRILIRFGLKRDGSRTHPDDMTRHQLVRELNQLRTRSDAWDAWFDDHVVFLTEQGVRVPASRIIPEELDDDDVPTTKMVVEVEPDEVLAPDDVLGSDQPTSS